MRTKCRHDRSSWHYLGVPFTIQGWIWTNIGTNVGTIAQVGTISAYLSLYKSGFGQTFVKLTFCKVELVQFWARCALSEVDLVQHWSKWALSGVDLDQDLAKWTLSGSKSEQSGHYRGQIWTNIDQSGHYRGPIWAKLALSGVYMVQGWIWTHYRMVKVDDSSRLSTKSRGQVGNLERSRRIRSEASYRNIEIDMYIIQI